MIHTKRERGPACEMNRVEPNDGIVSRWSLFFSQPFTFSGVTALDGAVYCIGGTYGPSGTKYCFKLEQGPDEKWDRIANMITGEVEKSIEIVSA